MSTITDWAMLAISRTVSIKMSAENASSIQPMIRSLRVSRMPPTFSTASVMKRRSKMSAATAVFPESSLGYHFAIP
jgi:hypothetical protein